jgi:hypothetical protein
MDGPMPLLKLAVAFTFVSLLAATASAQHFPLKPGEWEVSTTATTAATPDQSPTTVLFCFTDDSWTKALSQNPSCTIQNLSVTATGASYNVDCPFKTMQMKGTVSLSFDGMTHMTGKGSLDFTVNGKTTHSDSHTDYHWKQSQCSPNDMNLRQHAAH